MSKDREAVKKVIDQVNEKVPKWMKDDRSVDGYVVDTRCVYDLKDYETAAYKCDIDGEIEVNKSGVTIPKLDWHTDVLEDAETNHMIAREVVEDMLYKGEYDEEYERRHRNPKAVNDCYKVLADYMYSKLNSMYDMGFSDGYESGYENCKQEEWEYDQEGWDEDENA